MKKSQTPQEEPITTTESADPVIPDEDQDQDESRTPEELASQRWDQALAECDAAISATSISLSGFAFTPDGETLAEALEGYESYRDRKAHLTATKEALQAVRPYVHEKATYAHNAVRTAVRRIKTQPLVDNLAAESDMFRKAELLRQLSKIGSL